MNVIIINRGASREAKSVFARHIEKQLTKQDKTVWNRSTK